MILGIVWITKMVRKTAAVSRIRRANVVTVNLGSLNNWTSVVSY